MAEDDGPSSTSTIAKRLGVNAVYGGQYRLRLLTAGVSEAAGRGYVDFAVPTFREFLRESPACGLRAPGEGVSRPRGALCSGLVPVSYVILRRGNSVLLQLRQGTGYMDGHWATAAAGHVETGESSAEAARREAREELGVEIDANHLLPLTTMHRSQGNAAAAAGRIDFFFTCESWTGREQIMEPDKAGGLKWFDLDELPEALVPHERFVLERLKSGLPPTIAYGFAVLSPRPDPRG